MSCRPLALGSTEQLGPTLENAMTVTDNEDPAAPDEVDECEALIACLSDDAELLRRQNPECEIAANMEAAADMLEKLQAAEIAAAEAFGVIVNDKHKLQIECARLRMLLDDCRAQIRRQAALLASRA